ncbi:hypothetical protein DFQ26_007420 [Actinomortierella ambigua]|nr:hypothetical protein DFQ26_007420 [Actinomortierella ambigua]
MTVSKNSKMMNLINYRLRITLSDSRVLTGHMLAFDKHMNLVLSDCEEFRKIKPKTQGAAEREEKRTLGLVILRGEIIVSLSVDGPPPPSAEDQKARLSKLQAGTGTAAPAGRGMPIVPGVAAPGLTGPVRGVGGPAPGMMLPRGPAAAAPPMAYGRGMPPGMPPPGFRPMGGGPPGMPGMPPPGFRPPMGQPPNLPPGFRPRPGMPGPPPPGFPPGFQGPPPGFQPPPGFRPPPPGFRPPPQ